ncbi:unnamed protein product, partial [Prorocentrum cordatum]
MAQKVSDIAQLAGAKDASYLARQDTSSDDAEDVSWQDTSSDDAEAKVQALDHVHAMVGDQSYDGILKLASTTTGWAPLMSRCRGQIGDTFTVGKNLTSSLEKVFRDTATTSDVEALFVNLRVAFPLLLEDGSGKLKVRVIQALRGLEQVSGKLINIISENFVCVVEHPETVSNPDEANALLQEQADEIRMSPSRTAAATSWYDDLSEKVNNTVRNSLELKEVRDALDSIASVGEEITSREKLFDAVHKTLTTWITVRSKAGEEKLAIFPCWEAVATLKDAVSTKYGLDSEVTDALDSIESKLELDDLGATLYKTRVATFKEAVFAHAVACTNLNGTTVTDAAAVELVISTGTTVRDMAHPCLQVCRWSETPGRDRAAIALVRDVILCVTSMGHVACKMDANIDVEFAPSADLDSSISQMSEKAEDVSLSITWLMGDSMGASFAGKVKSWCERLMGASVNATDLKLEEIDQLMNAILSKLVEKGQDMTWAQIVSKFKAKDAGEVKSIRYKLKTAVGELPEGKRLKKHNEVLGESRFQTFKWGVATLMTNPSIGFTAADGREIRSNLKDVWAVSGADEQFKKYLGEGVVKEVEDILAIKDEAGEGENRTSESKGKRAKAASASSGPE